MRQIYLLSLIRMAPVAVALIAAAARGQSPPSPDIFAGPPSPPIPFALAWMEEIPKPSSSDTGIRAAGYETDLGPDSGWLAQDWTSDACREADLCPTCNACPNKGMYAFFGYDSWRGIQDDGWGNNGLHAGLNFGTRLGPISDWTGVGFQIGGSVGVYNWNGTDFHLSHNDESTPQGFVTYGFFRKANEQSNWSGAVVQDWMLTSNFGIFAENPTMAQWRGQFGYAMGPWNEVGVWGTWRGQGDTRVVNFFGPTTWRAVNQLNAYWHYKWAASGSDTWLWVGVPEHDRLAGGGSLGDVLVGALANCPLGDRVMLYALVTYMHPSASPGPPGSNDEAWNFTIGLSFFPARNARTTTIAGDCWMPQLPVANNGYFLVDQNRTY